MVQPKNDFNFVQWQLDFNKAKSEIEAGPDTGKIKAIVQRSTKELNKAKDALKAVHKEAGIVTVKEFSGRIKYLKEKAQTISGETKKIVEDQKVKLKPSKWQLFKTKILRIWFYHFPKNASLSSPKHQYPTIKEEFDAKVKNHEKTKSSLDSDIKKLQKEENELQSVLYFLGVNEKGITDRLYKGVIKMLKSEKVPIDQQVNRCVSQGIQSGLQDLNKKLIESEIKPSDKSIEVPITLEGPQFATFNDLKLVFAPNKGEEGFSLSFKKGWTSWHEEKLK